MEVIDKFYVKDGVVEGICKWQEPISDTYIYEVIKIIDSKPLFYEEHYKRLKNSCTLVKGNLYIKEDELKNLILKLINANNKAIGNIKIIYGIKNKEIRIFFIKHSYPTKEMYDEGVNTILYFGERNNPNAKIVNSEFRNKVNKKLKEKKAFEAILIDHNNLITEGSKSNIFLIKKDSIITSKVEKVLPGVTRTEIINMARKDKMNVIEKNVDVNTLKDYDAMFITGTSPDILPIRSVGNIEFNVKNEVLLKLMEMFKTKISIYLN